MVIGIEAAHANKPNRTGVEEYCWQIIQELKYTIPATERVVLYTNEPLRGELAKLPSHWEAKVLRWPLKKLWSQTRLAWELFFHSPDVFFAPGQLLPWLSPKKSVVTVHDSAFMVFPKAFNFFGRQYLKLMQFWIATHAKKIITPSEFSKRELQKYYHWVSEKKVTVIPEGYNSQNYYKDLPLNKEVLQKYGISKPYLVTIGRLEEKKNTRRLVEAFNAVRSGRSLQLVLIGSPRVGYESVKEAITNSPYRSDIFELGFVPNEAAAQLVAQAKAFVFPSLHEGFGIPLLEAMAVGCPVISSTAGALEETGGTGALYVNPNVVDALAKAIKQFLENDELREEYQKKGFEHAATFSWAKAALATWQVIVSVK